MFNINKKEKLPSTPSDSQKSYEEYATLEARSYNTFLQNLLGQGLIDKEDIMRVDAELESQLMDQIKEKQIDPKKNGNSLAYLEQQLEFLKGAQDISSHFGKENTYFLSRSPGVPPVEMGVASANIKGENHEFKYKDHSDRDSFKALKEIEVYRKAAIEKLIDERKQQKLN